MNTKELATRRLEIAAGRVGMGSKGRPASRIVNNVSAEDAADLGYIKALKKYEADGKRGVLVKRNLICEYTVTEILSDYAYLAPNADHLLDAEGYPDATFRKMKRSHTNLERAEDQDDAHAELLLGDPKIAKRIDSYIRVG